MATVAQLRTFLQPPDTRQSQENALATLRADFNSASLDDASLATSLASKLQEHIGKQRALEEQAEASTASVKSILSNARSRLSGASTRAHGIHEDHLQLEGELIDYREALLRSATPQALDDASTSPNIALSTLLQTLEAQQRHLRSVCIARDWFATLQKVEAECLVARQLANARRWDESLESWRRLVHMCDAPAIDPTVVYITRSIAVAVWHYIDAAVAKLIGEALEGVQWPLPVKEHLEPYRPQGAAIQQAVTIGLKLQRAGESFQSKLIVDGQTFPPECLVPVRALVQPLVLRFRYHFDGERQTNRLDKPEWYFTHVSNLLTEHERFIKQDFQPMLAPNGYGRVDAMAQVSELLVAQIERKIRNTAPQLVEMPPVLAHTIYQALHFDATLKERHLTPLGLAERSEEWTGTADVILGNGQWFDAWVEAEKKFVDTKYYEIIGAADAWQVAADYTPDEDDTAPFSPTNSALHVRDLFGQVTERYRPLLKFEHRVPFLLLIQIPLLEAYLGRITSSIDAFETLSFGLMRAVPGSIGEGVGAKVTAGVAGAQRLMKASLSARWMAGACAAWDDDLIFLELLDNLQHHILHRPDLRTAAASVISATAKAGTSNDAALFTPFNKGFDELAGRSEALLVKHVVREVTNELKPYASQRWNIELSVTSAGSSNTPMDLSPLAVPAISIWNALARALLSTLPGSRAAVLFRQIAHEVQDFIISRIVLSRSMTAITFEGGKQFAFDVSRGWVGALQRTDGSQEGFVKRPETALRRLSEVGVILSLPSTPADSSEDVVSFSRAMQAAFSDDEPAFRKTMDELGIRSLSRSEVQATLRRRPECWR